MNNNIKCCNCDWEGTDDDLLLVEFDFFDDDEVVTATETPNGVISRKSERPKDVDFLKGCPNCETDACLIDLN